MFTDSHISQINVQSPARRSKPAAFSSVEERFRRAKARLSAAQQEKMEAAYEFMAARDALTHWLEEVWPVQGE